MLVPWRSSGEAPVLGLCTCLPQSWWKAMTMNMFFPFPLWLHHSLWLSNFRAWEQRGRCGGDKSILTLRALPSYVYDWCPCTELMVAVSDIPKGNFSALLVRTSIGAAIKKKKNSTEVHQKIKIRTAVGRQWHPTPVLLPGKSHGWRSLVGCSPWGRWGSDTTEGLHFHFLALEKEMATHASVLA